MKKMTAIILGAIASLTVAAPALSGCGSDGLKFVLSEDGSHYTVSYSGFSSPSGECEIPAYYGDDNIPVTEIADEGFASTRYSKIKIPATITEIGTAAFSFCYSLESVEFADGIELDTLKQGTFGKCSRLKEIKIPDSVTAIGALVFSGCTELTNVTLGSVESIGPRAFEECTALEEITFPSTLTSIGDFAFYFSGLKEIEIPGSITDKVTQDESGKDKTVYGLGTGAFYVCNALESVKICEGVKTIPSGAFGYCTSLKEIHIPLSVEKIMGITYKDGALHAGHAFWGCTALADIYYAGSEEQWRAINIDYNGTYEGGVEMNNDALKNAQRHYKK